KIKDILLLPSLYIGPVDPIKEVMWVYEEQAGMIQREISYAPGLQKIFDEIIVNAVDNKLRDSSMDTLKVDIDPAKNVIKVFYNGKGIPVVEHDKEKMSVPSLVFCHSLTSFNCNHQEETVINEDCNCFGAKLCNIFSRTFELKTGSKVECKSFKQTWTNNMTNAGTPEILPYFGEDFTEITFSVDLTKFNMAILDKDIQDLLSRRVVDVAASTRGVKVYLNGKIIPINNFEDYVDLFLKGGDYVYEAVSDFCEIAVAPSEKGFMHVSQVNKYSTTKGGKHVHHVTERVVQKLQKYLKETNKRNGFDVDVEFNMIKMHLMVFVNCSISNMCFNEPLKNKMTNQLFKYAHFEPSDHFFTRV
ncbi:hypothetical protein DAPPUDRAFT_47063, partial [Daphnia pulex]